MLKTEIPRPLFDLWASERARKKKGASVKTDLLFKKPRANLAVLFNYLRRVRCGLACYTSDERLYKSNIKKKRSRDIIDTAALNNATERCGR